jgi:hypothetical protein
MRIMNLVLKSPDAVVEALRARFGAAGDRERRQAESVGVVAPSEYIRVRQTIGCGEIAADFQWPTSADLEAENRGRPFLRSDGSTWWLFATTGSGDAWLIRHAADPKNQIAFLDHDKEAAAQAEPLKISFLQWLVLADLMAQLELATSRDRSLLDATFRLTRVARDAVRSQLDKVSPGLADRYPLNL